LHFTASWQSEATRRIEHSPLRRLEQALPALSGSSSRAPGERGFDLKSQKLSTAAMIGRRSGDRDRRAFRIPPPSSRS